MNRNRIITAAFVFVLAAGTCFAQVDVPKTLGNVDLYGVKMFEVHSNTKSFTMNLTVTTTNANTEALKLRKGVFEVIFEGQDGMPILLGTTSVVEHIIPGQRNNNTGKSDLEMVVAVGPQTQATLKKILDVINIIGNPKANLIISIQGKSEVGMELPRGWVYEQGKRIEMELVYTPSVQREWVLN